MVLLGILVSYSHDDAWHEYITTNLPQILSFLEQQWQPKLYRKILWLVSNLPVQQDCFKIYESSFYHVLTTTEFTSLKHIRELQYAVVNLLIPHLESSYMLGYYECPNALLQCLKLPQSSQILHVLALI